MLINLSVFKQRKGYRRESYDEKRRTIMAHWGTRRSNVWLGLVLFISLMLGASTAQGSPISFDMSIEFSGPAGAVPPEGIPPEGAPPWLRATFTDSGVDIVTLTLEAINLTDKEIVKEWLFNLDPSLLPGYDATDLVFSNLIKTGSFNDPTINTGVNSFMADGDGFFDIEILFSTANGSPKRFGVLEKAEFTISGIVGLTAESFNFVSWEDGGQGEYETAAHILAIGQNNNDSGWVATPEPATLAVLLIGSLALLRKRKA